MKKSMIFVPMGVIGAASVTYMLLNKTQKRNVNKMVKDVKNSMDNMMNQ